VQRSRVASSLGDSQQVGLMTCQPTLRLRRLPLLADQPPLTAARLRRSSLPGAAHSACLGSLFERQWPPALHCYAGGGHGHHDSVTHEGLTIHKAATWHVVTGKAFAGLMW
jgi:hypothetical protein